MKTLFATDSQTILLDGDVEHPTDRDLDRINAIREELSAKHADEGGIIAYQSSKKSQYKQLTIKWVSKPQLRQE